MTYERQNISRLAPYTPGEQPKPGDRQTVKLNTNENPYPPGQAVVDALRSIDGETLRRYPPPTAAQCRQTIAQAHSLDPKQVIVTNGGDELLRLAITVFCQPRADNPSGAATGGLGIATPSYSLYEVLAAIHDTPLTSVPLLDNFELPDSFAGKLNDAGCRLAMVVNPHAPSGRLGPLDRLERIAQQFKGVLLIDEAYVDFATRDALPLLATDKGLKNVLLLRTLSKGYSLAGLRLGYGLGHPDLIAALDKARDSYNTDAVAQTLAIAALNNRQQAAQTWQAVTKERDRLTGALADRGYRVYPSQANFLLAQAPRPAKTIYESLKSKGVLVRYFDQDPLRDKLRITVGTPQQNDALLTALDSL